MSADARAKSDAPARGCVTGQTIICFRYSLVQLHCNQSNKQSLAHSQSGLGHSVTLRQAVLRVFTLVVLELASA